MCVNVPYLIVTLSGSGMQFRGFLIQARLMSDDTTRVGSFSNPPAGTRLSSCSPPEVCEQRIQTQNIELEKKKKEEGSFLFDVFTHTLTWNVILGVFFLFCFFVFFQFSNRPGLHCGLEFYGTFLRKSHSIIAIFCSRNWYSHTTIPVKLNSEPL